MVSVTDSRLERRSDAAGSQDTLILIPAFNEAQTIAQVVSDAVEAGYDVLVVDDGSMDSTASRATAAGAKVARLATNLGVGSALRCGFRYAASNGYRQVVQVDADGQHLVSEVLKLLASAPQLKLVVGSRFEADKNFVSLQRRIAISFLKFRLRRLGIRINDPTSGFRLFRDELIYQFALEFPSTYLGDTFEALILASETVGPTGIGQVPVTMTSRQGGKPSTSATRSLALLVRVVLSTSKPMRPSRRRTGTITDSPWE